MDEVGNQELAQDICDNEFLYRGIDSIHWDSEKGHISSAAFKNKNGVSVDRDGGRTEQECVRQLISKRAFAVIGKLLAGNVRLLPAAVVYNPTPDNKYHSEIHSSNEKVELTDRQARSLSRNSAVIFTD